MGPERRERGREGGGKERGEGEVRELGRAPLNLAGGVTTPLLREQEQVSECAWVVGVQADLLIPEALVESACGYTNPGMRHTPWAHIHLCSLPASDLSQATAFLCLTFSGVLINV